MKKLITLLLVVVVMASVSQAVVISASADAMIQSANGDINYGDGTYLPALADDSPSWQKSYTKFDASGLPTITDISSFTMYYDYNYYRQASFYLIEDTDGGDDTDAWIESGASGITWNNAPGNNTTGAGYVNDATYTSTYLGVNDDAGSTYSVVGFDWDSAAAETALINALNTGDRVATIAISRSSTSRWAQFASKEGDQQEMRLDVVPEPATIGLLAIGSLLVSRRRK